MISFIQGNKLRKVKRIVCILKELGKTARLNCLRWMHEGYPSCWFPEVDMSGKVYVLLKNTSISIIREKYAELKQQWVGEAAVAVIAD